MVICNIVGLMKKHFPRQCNTTTQRFRTSIEFFFAVILFLLSVFFCGDLNLIRYASMVLTSLLPVDHWSHPDGAYDIRRNNVFLKHTITIKTFLFNLFKQIWNNLSCRYQL